MVEALLAPVGIALMVLFLFLVPLGLPGTWMMLLVPCAGAAAGRVGWVTLTALFVLAGVAELAEWVIVRRISGRYGGSSLAFWGAIAGGIVGAAIGIPVPLAGPLIAGVVGTFLGAAAVTLVETRAAGSAARVGWGAVLGRAVSVALKSAVGIVILVVGGAALLR